MNNLSRGLVAGLSLALLVSCAARVVPTKPPTREPIATKAVKYFAVTKRKPWHKIGCKIELAPSKGPEVVVSRGDVVTWILGNDCDAAKDITLTFYPAGSPKQEKGFDLIDFERVRDGVLQGTVRNIDMGGAAYRVFKYRVRIGNHQIDPEIIIF